MIYPPYSLNFSLFQDEAIAQVGTMAMKETFPVKVTASTGRRPSADAWYGTNDAYLRETRQKLAPLRQDLKKTEDETVFKGPGGMVSPGPGKAPGGPLWSKGGESIPGSSGGFDAGRMRRAIFLLPM